MGGTIIEHAGNCTRKKDEHEKSQQPNKNKKGKSTTRTVIVALNSSTRHIWWYKGIYKKPGIDFKETFTLVVKFVTFRILITYVAINDLGYNLWDII